MSILNLPHWQVNETQENKHDYRILAEYLTLPKKCLHCQSDKFSRNGTLNEWAMKELSDAIENMPKSFERLAQDAEWGLKKDQWTFAHTITGAFAKYAIIQSPFGVPEGLEKVCNYLHSELLNRICWDAAVPLYEDGRNDKRMVELSLCEINKLLHEILYDKGIAEFNAWNETKPDFIDLDALLHNVCLDIRTERRDFKAFNEKFDSELEAQSAIQIGDV